jgi:hypothetical protein
MAMYRKKPVVIEATNQEDLGNMSFGLAIVVLKSGGKVARAGWNGKGMFLLYVNKSAWHINNSRISRMAEDGRTQAIDSFDSGEPKLLPFIGMHTAQGEFVPWLASQTDMLAEDWCILENHKASKNDNDLENLNDSKGPALLIYT